MPENKKSSEHNRIPAHPPTPQGFVTQAPQRFILMTPQMAAIGGLVAFFTVVLMVVVLPTTTYNPPPSTNWAPLSNAAMRGRAIYISNGCLYCHSGFTRPQDVYQGRYYLYTRISEPGDYQESGESPNILGTERTGPDLSQEGGHHPDGWHVAHYWSPRSTMPISIMPRFNFLTDDQTKDLIAFNQSQGGKEALLRYAAITVGGSLMRSNMGMMNPEETFPDLVQQLQQEENADLNLQGDPMDKSPSGLPWMMVWMMNSFERSYWLTKNPLPLTQQNLIKGKAIFLERCIGCHGEKGDGKGPAAQFLMPTPFDFTSDDVNGPGASDGQMYHRILTAGPGTAMENFGTRLSVEDIWRVVLFLRTIQNGGLEQSLPTVDMYKPWSPPKPMLNYIDNHPIESRDPGPGFQEGDYDPFFEAARWVSPGMAKDDMILIGGKLPMTLDRLASVIRTKYFDMLQQAYDDANGRGEELPSKDLIMSTEDLRFYGP